MGVGAVGAGLAVGCGEGVNGVAGEPEPPQPANPKASTKTRPTTKILVCIAIPPAGRPADAPIGDLHRGKRRYCEFLTGGDIPSNTMWSDYPVLDSVGPRHEPRFVRTS